jgi:hypothetical protein
MAPSGNRTVRIPGYLARLFGSPLMRLERAQRGDGEGLQGVELLEDADLLEAQAAGELPRAVVSCLGYDQDRLVGQFFGCSAQRDCRGLEHEPGAPGTAPQHVREEPSFPSPATRLWHGRRLVSGVRPSNIVTVTAHDGVPLREAGRHDDVSRVMLNRPESAASCAGPAGAPST